MGKNNKYLDNEFIFSNYLLVPVWFLSINTKESRQISNLKCRQHT